MLTGFLSLLTIKGAPDVLIGRCSHYTTSAGETRTLDSDMRATLEQAKNNYSSQGKRCILLARKIVRKEKIGNQIGTSYFEDEMFEQAKSGLTLVGLVAIVDPLRPEIRSVVSTLRGAGIRFFMVGEPYVSSSGIRKGRSTGRGAHADLPATRSRATLRSRLSPSPRTPASSAWRRPA